VGWLCHSDVTWAAGCAGLPEFFSVCVCLRVCFGWGAGVVHGSEAFKSFEWWLMPAPGSMACVQCH
jgi:hypothetical protein